MAVVLANLGKEKAGIDKFYDTLSFLEQKGTDDKAFSAFQCLKQNTEDLLSVMFMGNHNYRRSHELIQKIISEGSEEEYNHFMNLYAIAYLYIDNGLFDKALYILNVLDGKFNLVKESYKKLFKLRYHVACAEAYLAGFRDVGANQKELAQWHISEARLINKTLKNRFFDAFLDTADSFIIGDKNKLLLSVSKFHKNQFIHYYNWYKHKLNL